jgi:hypothetical protein
VDQAVGNVHFAFDRSNTDYAEDVGDLEWDALLLPFLRGYGLVADAPIAMTLDPTLLTMGQDLQTLAGLSQFDAFLADIPAFLFRWAGVEGVDPASRGAIYYGGNARELAFLEKFTGLAFVTPTGTTNPDGTPAWARVGQTFDHAVLTVAAKFIAQADGALQSVVKYDAVSDEIILNVNTTAALDAAVPVDDGEAALFWAILSQAKIGHDSAGLALRDHILTELQAASADLTAPQLDFFNIGLGSFVGPAVNWYDGLFGAASGFRPQILLGSDAGDDRQNGYGGTTLDAGRSIFHGGAGADWHSAPADVENIMIGGTGNDDLTGGVDGAANIWYYRPGDGQDTIRALSNAEGLDRVVFAPGITVGDVTYARDGDHLMVQVGVGSNSIGATKSYA